MKEILYYNEKVVDKEIINDKTMVQDAKKCKWWVLEGNERVNYVYYRDKTKEELAEDYKNSEEYRKLNKELSNLKRFLADNDYLVNKVVLGELDSNSEEFQEYLKKRKEAIIRINELESELKKE